MLICPLHPFTNCSAQYVRMLYGAMCKQHSSIGVSNFVTRVFVAIRTQSILWEFAICNNSLQAKQSNLAGQKETIKSPRYFLLLCGEKIHARYDAGNGGKISVKLYPSHRKLATGFHDFDRVTLAALRTLVGFEGGHSKQKTPQPSLRLHV